MLKSTYNSDTPGHRGSVAMTLFCPVAGTLGIDHLRWPILAAPSCAAEEETDDLLARLRYKRVR